MTREVTEAATALKMEAACPKAQILKTCRNTLLFLYNAFGMATAAQTSFDEPLAGLMCWRAPR